MREAFAGSQVREEARQRVLREFAADVYGLLEGDATPEGKLLCGHIRRQMDLVHSGRYADWFRQVGGRFGFDQAATLAAVAGSDVTKVSLFSAAAREHFGTTSERVAALAAQNDLRYGRVFDAYTPLENLYMHAEAGRHYTRAELARRGAGLLGPAAEGVAAEVSEGVVGHDSFNAGFGRHKLKPFLAARHKESPDAFAYPRSGTPVAFLVQVLDRIEGCDPQTMLRYVEECVRRKDSLARAVKTGVVENYAYLREVYEEIERDARAALTPDRARVFMASPCVEDFARGIARLPRILALFRPHNSADAVECYDLKRGEEWIRLDGIEAFREHFAAAVAADAGPS